MQRLLDGFRQALRHVAQASEVSVRARPIAADAELSDLGWSWHIRLRYKGHAVPYRGPALPAGNRLPRRSNHRADLRAGSSSSEMLVISRSRSHVGFDLAALDPGVILELAASRSEGIRDRDVDVFMAMVEPSIRRHRDHAAGDHQLDPSMEQVALTSMSMRLLDHDGAALDAIERGCESGHRALDRILDRGTGIHGPEGDGDGNCHDVRSCTLRATTMGSTQLGAAQRLRADQPLRNRCMDLATVTDRVLARDVKGDPCMTTAPHPIAVVVAYDFSPSSEHALRAAIELAALQTRHVLHIVGVLDPHDRVTIGGVQEDPTYETADKVQKLIGEHVTAAFAGRPTEGEVEFHVHARIGKAALELLVLAEEVGADLIYIGSHGKKGVERLLLGSVSERIVREAKCPVVVARPKTYADVDLLKVVRYEHVRQPHREPHVYSYSNRQVILRPDAWPIS